MRKKVTFAAAGFLILGMLSTTDALAVPSAAPLPTLGDHVPHTVVVKYRDGVTAPLRGALERLVGVETKLGEVAANHAQILRVRGDVGDAIASLVRSPLVEYAEPDVVLRQLAVPNDTRFGELYGLNNGNDADMDAPEGWDAAGLGAFPSTGGVKVGIIDTGIDAAHEDLVGRLADCGGVTSFPFLGLFGGNAAITDGSKCTDDNDHGSHVAGTIAAIANNGKGVTGVAFNSSLSICKALDAAGSGSTTGVANCITYLKNKGVKVISMSLGGGASSSLQAAVRGAWNNGNGALIVAAAGNDGNSTLNYPAAYPEVVSVAATDSNDARASFSNVNSDVEIAAAGVNVLSVKRGGGYVAFSGTSMATPHVAGVVALILYKNPTWTAAQVRTKLQSSVDDLGAAGRDATFGFGRVNLVKAMTP
ncbi:MAG: S8 family peptidase [Acidimicrobiales bacterium]|nr:S8 family peptidase [Acidimicrobiales bacterium]